MDYMTKPLSRTAIRKLSKCIREIFGLSADEPFPVLEILEKLPSYFKVTNYLIVEDY